MNADLSYHPETQTYRLYITEITKGVYQMEFKYSGKGAISILQTNYINIPSMLSKAGSAPPYDATFQAVQLLETDADKSLRKYNDMVAVTTGVYHTIILKNVLDFNGNLISSDISKFLIRYAYYEVGNDIKYSNGLLILKQTLPEDYEDITP